MPLLDMVRDMHGFILAEGQQNFYVGIIMNRQLEEVEKDQYHLIESSIHSPWYPNVPFHDDPYEGVLK
jgi:hypothetical protein